MKKLLVILLLFFTVHGAWAEDLYLICNMKFQEGIREFSFTIDSKNNKVKNSLGVEYPNVSITDKAIKFELMKHLLDEKVTKMVYFINRHTGAITVSGFDKYEKISTIIGNCNKNDKKKKF